MAMLMRNKSPSQRTQRMLARRTVLTLSSRRSVHVPTLLVVAWSAAAAAALLALLSIVPTAQATGKGPVGIYAITDRYVAVADSALDAILFVDVEAGGVVGRLVLHGTDGDPPAGSRSTSSADSSSSNSVRDRDGDGDFVGGARQRAPTDKWINPTGIASCDSCGYIYLTTGRGKHVYRIRLDRTLREMADDGGGVGGGDDSFSLRPIGIGVGNGNGRAVLEPYWPWDDSRRKEAKPRLVAVARDGSVGYVADKVAGLYRFHPLEDEAAIEGGENKKSKKKRGGDRKPVLRQSEFDDSGVMGVAFSRDDSHLLVTSETHVYIVDAHDPASEPMTAVNLRAECGGGDVNYFRDAAIVGPYMYTIGHRKGQPNTGMALYRLGRIAGASAGGRRGSPVEVEQWGNCTRVAGNNDEPPGWVDGMEGSAVRFTRPHAMALLPGSDVIVATDIDNRAVRFINVSRPDEVHVSTVSYDEDLWHVLYGPADYDRGNEKAMQLEMFSDSAGSELNTATVRVDAEGAAAACLSRSNGNMQLCPLVELRAHLPSKEKATWWDWREPMTLWTSESCHSCWLHFPGYCGPVRTNESAVERSGSYWGSNYQMIAVVSRHGIRTECTRRDEPKVVMVTCCGLEEGDEERRA